MIAWRRWPHERRVPWLLLLAGCRSPAGAAPDTGPPHVVASAAPSSSAPLEPVPDAGWGALGGFADGGGTLGVAPRRGMSAAAACAKIAELPEVARAKAHVVPMTDLTDNEWGCTGGAGECLHWCRVDPPLKGARLFGIDPHDATAIVVCRTASTEACAHGAPASLEEWRTLRH